MPLQSPSPIRGMMWMIGQSTSFSAMNVCVAYLSDSVSPLLQVFLRSLIAVLILLPFMLHWGFQSLRTDRLRLHVLRAFLTYLGVATLFISLKHLPLSEVIALHFTTPLFGILFAALFLKEKLRLHRLLATGMGLCGVLIILRPGFLEINVMAFVVLLSAAFYAGGAIVVKSLTRSDSAFQIVFMTNMLMIPISLFPAMFDWTVPTLAQAPVILLMGLASYAALTCQARALALADASFIVPLDFLRLPLMVGAGYLLFSEATDIWTVVGAVVVFSSVYYLTWKERAHLSSR